MAAPGLFENVRLGARGTSALGTLNVSDSGITWKRQGGTNAQVLNKCDILELLWTPAPAGGLLRVRQAEKPTVHYQGFAKEDQQRLSAEVAARLGLELKAQALSLSGHNWGSLALHGASVALQTLGGTHVLEVPLDEVSEVQGAKEDAILEFHVDDGALRGREDALSSVTFVIPEGNEDFQGTEEDGLTPADAFKAAIAPHTDTMTGEGDALATLDSVSSVFPRGRYDLSLFPGFMDMDGQNHQFKIRYANIERIYTLPRPQPAGSLVVVHLETAIRRGQTYYEWLAFFFDDKAHVDLDLNTSQEFLDGKNKANRANMELHMLGATDSVLTRLLRGLSGAKVTKQGSYRGHDGVSSWLGCSYRNDAGILYPLERAFLYTFKPELIPYDHVESVEFERQQSGMHASSLRTFDLSITIRPDAATRTKHFQFRSIQKMDWEPLLTFLEEKKIRVANLEQARQGPGYAPTMPLQGMGGAAGGEDEEEDDDDFGQAPGEDEDEAFNASDGSDSDSDSDSDAELVAEEGISVEAVGGRSKKAAKAEEVEDEEDKSEEEDEPEEKESESEPEEEEEEEVKPKKRKKPAAKAKGKADKEDGRKKRKKKDKDAPKGALSAYMQYCSKNREQVKTDNPGIEFKDIARKLAEQWKELDEDAKKPYTDLAAKDKERYKKDMEVYNAKKKEEAEADGDGEDDE